MYETSACVCKSTGTGIFFRNVKRMFYFSMTNGTSFCKTLAYFVTITKKNYKKKYFRVWPESEQT